ncbi:putative toxin-antitoxin system toxin component, PIN family [Nostoc sp.]|uniref:putative toxin-antitoxin system toxin component, PIN family n=1 Tax=Nostoc sp. TaxID=1180 RepID=UPI002FF7FF1D
MQTPFSCPISFFSHLIFLLLSELCPTVTVDFPQLRDPDDTVILATALAANAEVIVTGDLDLLVLMEFNVIPILTSQDFLNRYFPDML